MEVRRFTEAKTYDAANHRNYTSYRLFGAEAGGPTKLIYVLTHFLPGGGAGPDSSPAEKVYFCLAGEITIVVDGKEATLKPNDSVFIGADEKREIINRGHAVATIVAAITTQPK